MMTSQSLSLKEKHLLTSIEHLGKIKLFPYQEHFLLDCLRHDRVVGIFARQTGKTTIVALYAIYYAINNPEKKVLVIAPTDRQAGELFGRLKSFIDNCPEAFSIVKSSTQRELTFNNLTRIRSLPTGEYGHTIRGQTADLIILEESAFIKDKIVTQVIMPMIAATHGAIIEISTPFGKNHFYESAMSKRYITHQYDYTQSPLITEDFIAEQKERMTNMEFSMEYLAEFIEDSDAYFPYAVIQSAIEDYLLIKI